MGLTITAAQPADVPAIVELIADLDRFYGAATAEPAEPRIALIKAALFGEPPAAHVLLARVDGKPVGLASYSYLWPAAGVTRSLYLKELYVTADHRRGGIGTALLEHLRATAVKAGCSRLEWTADRDNPLAQGFYRHLGFVEHQGKAFYRMDLDPAG